MFCIRKLCSGLSHSHNNKKRENKTAADSACFLVLVMRHGAPPLFLNNMGHPFVPDHLHLNIFLSEDESEFPFFLRKRGIRFFRQKPSCQHGRDQPV